MASLRRLVALAALAVLVPAHAAQRIYPDVSRATADIGRALAEAGRTHRRVLVDFGGNWCTDCKVLDLALRRPENAQILARHYVVVHVNVGERGISDNFALAMRYRIPLRKGVPALAVLAPDGHLVYSQENGEFESMRSMDPGSVNAFLRKWQGD